MRIHKYKREVLRMKKRLWIGVAAAALAVGGVSAGLIGAKAAAPVKADTNSYYIVGSFTNSWSFVDSYIMTADGENYSLTLALAANDEFKSAKGAWGSAELGYDSAIFTSPNFTSNGTNIKVSVAGQYKITRSASAWVSAVKQTVTEYSVSEYAVVDGTTESTAYATETAYGNASFTPTTVTRAGYTHGGWYTDAACTTAYVAATPTADLTLYAKYTTLPIDSYVYFKAPAWTKCFAYLFDTGDGQFGKWPGKQVTEVTNGVNYQGSGFYRVGYNSTVGDTKIIFNVGTGDKSTETKTQTANLTLTAGSYYKIDDASTGDADLGKAAAVVYDINAARHAVVASGSILAASLCGISKADATKLVKEYDDLGSGSTAQGYVNTATDYVYNYQDTTKGADVTVNYLVAELRVLAASGSGTASISDTIHENSGLYITLGVLAAGLTAAGAMIFLGKKRKHAVR
jgi:uncharacterized repeat protein (TIGR02543 family)